MPLDAEVLAIYAAVPARPTVELARGEAALAAAQALRRADRPQGPLDFPGVTVKDVAIAGDGRALGLRVYRPIGDGPFGAMVNLHGGGWAIGNLALDDGRLAWMAAEAGVTIIAVDYRLAPEHPFPAALEDGMAALRWAQAGAGEFGVDPQRLAVGGSSAGGNLAAALALMCRDQGGPALRFQLLNYPVLDGGLDWPSYHQFGAGPGVTHEMMAWFWDVYADGADRTQPFMAPLHAESLAGLPPALIVTAGCDVLRDEAEAYAERLAQAGVPVDLVRYDGMPHGFISLSLSLAKSAEAVARAIGHLRTHLST